MALMGTVVVASLVGIRSVVVGSNVDRDHAVTFEWLQSASDAIHRGERVPCTADGQGRLDAIAAYDALAKQASIPPTWASTDASIAVTDVEYLGRTSVDGEFEWSQAFCFEGGSFADSPLFTQRVTIEVVAPSSSARQTLEMVKSE